MPTDLQSLQARDLIIEDIINELYRARALHPAWPSDPIHAAAVVAEEAGELVKAALDFHYAGKPAEDMRTEAIHTAATALRFLMGG